MPEISTECVDILNQMIRYNASERMSIDEILSHPWLSEESFEPEINIQVYEEFSARKEWLLSETNMS